MTTRRGLGAGRGKGYKNLIPHDRPVHQMSAKGMKQPQMIPMWVENPKKMAKKGNIFYASSYAKLEAMGVKPSDSLVGTVYNRKTGEIVAYLPSHTFSQFDEYRLSPRLKRFVFMGDGQELTIHAIDGKTAKMIIGVGNKYEEEWGDFGDIIKGLKSGVWKLYEQTTTYKRSK